MKREHLEFPSKQLKTYLHYHIAYGHQTWQGGDLPWGALTPKITRLLGHVIPQDHVTNWIHYNFTTEVAMITKLGGMVAHLDGLLSLKSEDSLIM